MHPQIYTQMFIAALFRKQKNWKSHKFSSPDEWAEIIYTSELINILNLQKGIVVILNK